MGSSAGRFEINLIDIYKEQFYFLHPFSYLIRLSIEPGGFEIIKQTLEEINKQSFESEEKS